MSRGRQCSEWPQVFAIIATVGNLFAAKGKGSDVRRYVPRHLGGRPAEVAQEREPTPEECKHNWQMVKLIFSRGNAKRSG